MRKKSFIVAVLATAGVLTAALVAPGVAAAGAPALSYVPDANWWVTNGRVADILPLGNRVYLSGGFDYIGPNAGHGVAVDGTAGTRLAGAPLVDGTVYASLPDGSGGWYIGGDFHHVGGQYRRDAARVSANGTVASWNPKPDGPVFALAQSGSSVIVGGSFSQLGKTAVGAADIGAVDATSGNPVPGFSGNANGTVRALVSSGASVYAAGDFTSFDGTSRSRLVRVSAANGAIDPSFSAQANAPVRALALDGSGSTLYAGGDFSAAYDGSNWQNRGRLAAYSTSAGSLSGWAPNADNTVYALAADPGGSTIYAGGLFGSVNGVARARLAALDGNGAVTPFDASLNGCIVQHVIDYAHTNPPCTPEVDALTITNGALYIGGRFSRAGATVRHDAGAFALAGGGLTTWNPVASDRPLTVSASGGNVFLGGDLTSVNGLVRQGVAALNASTGAGDPTFTADADNEVLDLQASPDQSTIYLAGAFQTVNGAPRKYLAAVTTSNGAVLTGFQANANNNVLKLAYAGGAVYAAGQFSKINGTARSHAAKLNPTTGAVDPTFIANTSGPAGALRANGMVQGMVASADGSKVYLAGPFNSINGHSIIGGIEVVNGATGALISSLGGVEGCSRVGPWIVHLYLSDDGKRLYGGDVCPDRMYQWDAVNLETQSNPTGLIWKQWCNGGMQGTLEINGHFYYGSHGGDVGRGGECWASPTNQTQIVQSRYAVFDATTGALQPDSPQFDTPMGVWCFAAVPQGLLVGGDFTWAGNSSQVHQGLVLFPGTP